MIVIVIITKQEQKQEQRTKQELRQSPLAKTIDV